MYMYGVEESRSLQWTHVARHSGSETFRKTLGADFHLGYWKQW